MARYPITWSVSEGGTRAAEPAVSLTGSDGIARFDLKSTTTGLRRVTASWGKEQSHSFEQVTFIEPLGLMIEFDGKEIQNLNDYAYTLRSKKPGDVVAVVVKRNGADVKTNVTLEARR